MCGVKRARLCFEWNEKLVADLVLLNVPTSGTRSCGLTNRRRRGEAWASVAAGVTLSPAFRNAARARGICAAEVTRRPVRQSCCLKGYQHGRRFPSYVGL